VNLKFTLRTLRLCAGKKTFARFADNMNITDYEALPNATRHAPRNVATTPAPRQAG